MIDREELAWAAGFHEGEGHIALRKNGGLVATVSQTNPEPLKRLQEIFGGSVYGPSIIKGGNKPVWVWSLNNVSGTTRYVYSILPWLSESKGEDALSKVERWYTKYQYNRRFCQKRGHDKEVVGTRKTTRGFACKGCEKEAKREHYLRKQGKA
jgi:hypothetical protein